MAPVIKIHNRCLPARLAAISRWQVPETTRRELRRFVEQLALGKVNPGRQICEARQVKYLDLLKIPLQFLRKPTDRLTVKDIERFEKALSSDQVRSWQKEAPYASSTKADIRQVIKLVDLVNATPGSTLLQHWGQRSSRAVDETVKIFHTAQEHTQRLSFPPTAAQWPVMSA